MYGIRGNRRSRRWLLLGRQWRALIVPGWWGVVLLRRYNERPVVSIRQRGGRWILWRRHRVLRVVWWSRMHRMHVGLLIPIPIWWVLLRVLRKHMLRVVLLV